MNIRHDQFLEKCCGNFTIDNKRTYWISPTGEKFHAAPVFLKRHYRICSCEKPVIEDKPEEVSVHEQPRELTIPEPPKEEEIKEKKKSKKKTKLKVENETSKDSQSEENEINQ